jgi:predicted enzyme related to lactoylglutathione lyase
MAKPYVSLQQQPAHPGLARRLATLTPMSGRVVHFEIPFDDGDRARQFYRDAFGWVINEIPEMHYNIVQTGPINDDGFRPRSGTSAAGWCSVSRPPTVR